MGDGATDQSGNRDSNNENGSRRDAIDPVPGDNANANVPVVPVNTDGNNSGNGNPSVQPVSQNVVNNVVNQPVDGEAVRAGANRGYAVMKLGTYNGSQALETHLAKFEKCASFYNCSARNRVCYLKNSLTGDAGVSYVS